MTEDGDTVDNIVDAAVERADATPDTFRPVSVDDRFDNRVRDDHAPNQALHDALRAAAEDDDRIHSVNLMGSHAPGNKHKGEPRYNVRVDVRNDGMGHPVLGATVAGRMVDRGDVRITDVAECSDDHLVVCLRPRECRVEPIDVPVSDIPDDVLGVSERTVAAFLGDVDTRLHEELRSVAPLRVFRDVMRDYKHALPDPDREGADDRLQSLDVRLSDFPDGWRDEAVGPSAPIGLVESLEDLAAEYDKAAKNRGEDRGEPWRRAASDIRVALDDHVPGDTVEAPCGCGDYSVTFPSGDVPDSFDVVCPECGNHFGQGAAPDEPCPCDHDHDFEFDEPETMADATASGLGLAMVAESVARHGDGHGAPRRDVDIDDDAIDKAIDRGVVIERDGVLYDTREVVRKVQAVERGAAE